MLKKIKRFLIKTATASTLFLFPEFRRKINYLLQSEHFLFSFRFSKLNKENKFKYTLSALVCCKNEAPYILEWIEYHLLKGFEHFYIYDNESTDNLACILRPYVDKGVVTLVSWCGKNQQLKMYKNFIENYRNETKWVAIIDCDEFIVTKQTELTTFLEDLSGTCSQLLIPWVYYGSSGYERKTDGLVIERFLNHQVGFCKDYVKSIVNPRRIIGVGIHYSLVFGKSVDENKTILKVNKLPNSANKFQVNHYVIKSKEEFIAKRRRGRAFGDPVFDEDFFLKHDFNDVYEPDLMSGYVKRINLKLKK